MKLEELILGHLLMQPELLKSLDIDKDFFKDQKQRLVFREIQKGNEDLALISQKINIEGINSYLSSLLDGIAKTDSKNLLKYVNEVKINRLKEDILKLINNGAKIGIFDHDKIQGFYQEIKSFETVGEDSLLIDLDKIEPKPISWLWYNKIPLGKISLIVGDPGAGKSLLSLYMASVISRGDDWPDVKNPPIDNKGSVIILTAEDSLDDTVRVRADAMSADTGKIKIIEGMIPTGNQSDFFDIRKHIQVLEKCIKEVGDVKLIIFDPITAYLGDIEGNRNTQLRAALSPLAILADKHKVAVIGIHHLNKDQAKKALYRALGSVAFTATARSVWLVQQDEDDSKYQRRLFAPLKANICKNPTTLAFSINGPIGQPRVTFESMPVDRTAEELLADEETKERYSALEGTKNWLLEALKNGPLPSTQIYSEAKENAISERTLNRAKSKLGIVSEKEKDTWHWRLRN